LKIKEEYCPHPPFRRPLPRGERWF